LARFECCNIPQSPDGYYLIDHKTKGSCKVHFSLCCRCENPILKIDAGLLKRNIEYLRGRDARKFLKEYPYAPLTRTYKQYKKNTAKGIHYVEGKTVTVRELATDYIAGTLTAAFRQELEKQNLNPVLI